MCRCGARPAPEFTSLIGPARRSVTIRSLARTFRELTARFLQHSNFRALRTRYVLMQRSSPWAAPLRASMALNRQQMSIQQRRGRPPFWDRPSRALPDPKGPLPVGRLDRPVVGVVNGRNRRPRGAFPSRSGGPRCISWTLSPAAQRGLFCNRGLRMCTLNGMLAQQAQIAMAMLERRRLRLRKRHDGRFER